MPRAVDRLPLPVTHDPNQSLEFHVRMGLAKGTELWQLILDAIREHAEDLVRKLLQGLMQLPATVDQALEELYALLPDWLTELPGKVVEFINTHAGINLASWDALLDSLEDGKGIDLALIPQFVRALEGIPWTSGDPGAILRAILEAGGDVVRALLDRLRDGGADVFALLQALFAKLRPEWLPQIPVGKIRGGDQVSLVADGGFEDVPEGLPGRWRRDTSVKRSGLASVRIDGTGAADELVGAPIQVDEGDPLSFVGWLSCEDAVGGTSSVWVIEFDAAGERVGEHQVGALSLSGSKSWTKVELSYTVPAGVASVSLAARVDDEFTDGIARFDDVDGFNTGLFEQAWTRGLPTVISNIATIFGVTDSNLNGVIDAQDVWQAIVSVFLWPLNMLGKLVDGKLIDAHAPQIVQDAIDGIHNAFANGKEWIEDNLPRGVVPDAIYGLLGLNLDAKTSIAVLEAEVRLLKSAGNTLVDDFERPNSGNLGASWSDLHAVGGGSGGMGVRNGVAVWYPSGAGNRTRIYRYNAAQITTDAGELHFVLASDPPSTFPDDAFGYVCFRCSDSETSYMRLRIGRANIVLQAVVSGTVYTLASESFGFRSGDTGTIRFGKAGGTSLHTYSVLRKGQPVISEFTDPNSRSKTGAGFRGMGVGNETSLRIPLIPIPTQWVPVSFAAMTMAEVL